MASAQHLHLPSGQHLPSPGKPVLGGLSQLNFLPSFLAQAVQLLSPSERQINFLDPARLAFILSSLAKSACGLPLRENSMLLINWSSDRFLNASLILT